MNNVISSQSFKCVTSKAFKVFALITIPISVLLFVMFNGMKDMQEEGTIIVNGITTVRESVGGDMLLMVLGIFAALLFAMDFSSGSIRQIIGKGIDRTKYVVGTLVTIALYALLLMGTMMVILFVLGSVFGEGTGISGFSEIGWIIAGTLVFVTFFVSAVMFIACLSRKTSISLIFAILSISVVNIICQLLSLITKKNLLVDPGTMFSQVISAEATLSERIIPLVSYFILMLVFGFASIMVVRKRDM